MKPCFCGNNCPGTEIHLSRGLVAIVDADSHARLARHTWHSAYRGTSTYAATHVRTERPGERRKRAVVYMHRLVLNPEPGKRVDHADGDGLDNRRCNLRPCTGSQNIMNSKIRRGKVSRFKGVHPLPYRTKPWAAAIRLNGKTVRLGSYATEEEAALAYDKAALALFGEFARPNSPRCGGPRRVIDLKPQTGDR